MLNSQCDTNLLFYTACKRPSLYCLVYNFGLHVHCINPVLGIDKIPLKQDAGADQTMVFRTYDPEKVRTLISYLLGNDNYR